MPWNTYSVPSKVFFINSFHFKVDDIFIRYWVNGNWAEFSENGEKLIKGKDNTFFFFAWRFMSGLIIRDCRISNIDGDRISRG